MCADYLPESFKSGSGLCVGGAKVAPVSREGTGGDGDWMFGAWSPGRVGRQGGPGDGEGAGLVRKALPSEGAPLAQAGPGALRQRGVCLLHSSHSPGDPVPAAAQAFLRSFIIQHVLTA